MPRQEWFIQLAPNVIIRVDMTTNTIGLVTIFTAQLEIFLDGEWHVITRYDTAHGQAHIDYITPRGRSMIRCGWVPGCPTMTSLR